jgi:tetratricopeptide (TPR) repeat protein
MLLPLPLRAALLGALALPALAAVDLDREMVLAPHAGAAAEDAAIVRAQDAARGERATAADFERLAWAWVAKARRTLDAAYHKLAEKTIDVADARFGAGVATRVLRAHVLHHLHRFREAEAVAAGLVAERAEPAHLAILSDALIEQGKLAEGIAALQRLADLKPGAAAFTRIAHVRWLKGDLAGATAAMENALRATAVDDAEAHAWIFSRLSAYALQRGDTATALGLAEKSAARLPDYAPALLATGRALLAIERTADAIPPLRRAVDLIALPEHQWWLADALRTAGRAEEAAVVEARLMRRGALEDPRTFALFLATRGLEPATALRLARAELAERADPLTHDALAWAAFAAGDTAAAPAAEAMRAALAHGTRDARLALHAGAIALARGEAEAARAHFAAAQAMAATLTPSERALLARHTAAAGAVAAH